MIKLDKTQLILKKKQAYSFFKEFSFSKTIDLLKPIVAEDKNDAMCFFLLGTSYLHMKELDLSEKNLKISVNLNSEHYDSIHNLGLVCQLKQNFNEAINLFNKAIKLKPKNIGSLIHLAEVYEQVKSYDKAKKYYENVLNIDNKNFKANKGMARLCIKFGYHKLGLQFMQKSEGLIRFSDKNFEVIK
jgi:tetratricopeptide (TPR) repeat protein